jgi:hypothetical protein
VCVMQQKGLKISWYCVWFCHPYMCELYTIENQRAIVCHAGCVVVTDPARVKWNATGFKEVIAGVQCTQEGKCQVPSPRHLFSCMLFVCI